MSYPTKIRVLVVEDEPSVKRYYEELFKKFGAMFDIAPLRYAFSLDEALEHIQGETIFHLVIVDLRIPERSGSPTSEQELLGLKVIEACAKRENWPVPALLVFSGQMSGNLEHRLNEELELQFSYGKARVKPDVDGVVSDALKHIVAYSSVGIHELEHPDAIYAPLTPRERDLVRRSALENGAIGVYLSFFTSDFARGDPDDGYSGWTKVFVGRFFGEDYAPSSTSFFKLMPYREADVVTRDAHAMQNCLPHIKVRYASSSGRRYLLVTERVGSKDGLPSSLESLLGLESEAAKAAIVKAVQQIASQLDRLDQATPNRLRPREVLHMALMLVEGRSAAEAAFIQILLYRGGMSEEECRRPGGVLERLVSIEDELPVRMKKCHGDLNASNVAVDLDDDGVSAYIFDASGMRPRPTESDLAFLEITTLLHANPGSGSLVDACAPFYGEESAETLEDVQASARIFVEQIRIQAYIRCEQKTYALLLFDVVYGQVWGLAYGGSANKVKRREEAVKLLIFVSGWIERLFFPNDERPLINLDDPGF